MWHGKKDQTPPEHQCSCPGLTCTCLVNPGQRPGVSTELCYLSGPEVKQDALSMRVIRGMVIPTLVHFKHDWHPSSTAASKLDFPGLCSWRWGTGKLRPVLFPWQLRIKSGLHVIKVQPLTLIGDRNNQHLYEPIACCISCVGHHI